MTLKNSRWRLLLSALVLMFFSASPLLAQNVKLEITGSGIDEYEGCEDYKVTFKVTVDGAFTSIDSVELISGDRLQKFIRHDEWTVSGSNVFTFEFALPAGTYNPIARVQRNGTNVWEEAILLKSIKVYTNPTALFRITTDSQQCFEGNEACFKDLSRMGKEKHALVDTVFDVGSGDIIKQGNFCYSYPAPGFYDIVLTVIDEKGCVDEYVGKARMEVYPKIGADFRVVGPVGCPCTDIRFNNRTAFDQDDVDWWVWDWGVNKNSKDTFYMSNPDHKANWWTGFTRQYCKDGYHSPKLIVAAKDGCKDSLLLKDAIRVVNFNFDITWVPDTPCFTGNNVRFNMPPRPNATQLLWVFGDPLSMNLNVNREDWSPGHQYVGGPGFYNVSFTVLEPPCPARDTTICFVKLKGPSAAINLPNPPFSNGCKEPREIPKADFLRLKYDECFREMQGAKDPPEDEINWVTANTANQVVIDQYFSYCNASIDSFMFNADISANGMGDVSCGPLFTLAKQEGWVKKEIFKKVYIDSVNNRWKVTRENFRTSGITKYLEAGESVKYDGTSFTAPTSDFYLFYCDSFYFEKGDSIPRNPVVLDSFPVYEQPIDEPGLIAVADGYVVNKFFRREGVPVYLNKGESVDYRLDGVDLTFTATKNGVETIIADEFYFEVGDTVRPANGRRRNRYQGFTQSGTTNWNFTDAMPYEETLTIKDFVTPVGGGPKVEETFTVEQPFIGVHELEINGVAYIYRIASSPITHVNGTYRPPMYPGDNGCVGEWRTMHDTDKFTRNCGAPNLVTFTNNSTKYRMFGRAKSDMPPHTSHDMDNKPAALALGEIDSCAVNPNFPWASDSLLYLWNFGDDGDQCTTYYDANKNILVKGNNPSGDPLRCLFSEIVAPQHYYETEGCWTASLSAVDPVTGCTSVAQQPIVMEAPDGGPADPLGAAGIKDVNYYNQPAFQEDENRDEFRIGVRLGQGAPPCVGNDLNPYFQQIDVSETLPLCGRETFWMIFNRDDPHQDPNDDPIDNDCVKDECTVDGNGSLIKKNIVNRGALHPSGTYDVEWRVRNNGVWGASIAKGEAVINNLGFLDKVTITENNAGYANLDTAQMIFADSSVFPALNIPDMEANPIVAYGYEQVDTFWYDCNWIPEMVLQMIGMQWSYTTAGCKTPGIVIKVGDCFDTFFYENYRYFLDANGDFLINPHPNLYASEEEIRTVLDNLDQNPSRDTVYKDITHFTCTDPDPLDDDIRPLKLPYEMSFSVKDYRRNDPMPAGGHPVCDARDSLRTFAYFISKNANQCGPVSNGVFIDSVDMNGKGFDPITNGDTTLVNLRDTVTWTMRTPGKYVISTQARAKHGPQFCFGLQAKEIWVGQLQCFRYSDSVLCEREAVTFTDSVYYWDPRTTAFCELINWWENTTCIDTNIFFYSPDSNVARTRWDANPAVRWIENTNVKYDVDSNINEMIAWDFNSPRYVTDKNGNFVLDNLGQKIRMEDWRLQMDMKNMDIVINPDDSSMDYQRDIWKSDSIFRIDTIYRVDSPSVIDQIIRRFVVEKQRTREVEWTYGQTPEFGVGVYDVTLWARDSMGCWMPYTKHDAIRVVGVRANFTLCDDPGCNDTLICTPSATSFIDSTVILENKEDVPSGESLYKGIYDEIVKWKWEFGDKRDPSVLQNPAHTYLDANEKGYDVTLWVKTAQGCKAQILKPKFIKVIGPQAKFGLLNDTICKGDSVTLVDSSFSRAPATRIWTGGDPKGGQVASLNTQNDNNEVKKVKMFFDQEGRFFITQQISLEVYDPITGANKTCDDVYPNIDADEDSIFVNVRGLDPIKIDLSDTLVCPNDLIEAKVNIAETFAGYDSFYWEIDTLKTEGLVDKVNEIKYDTEGTYKIKLTGSGDWPLCPDVDSTTFRVKEVSADVEIDKNRSNTDLGNYEFENFSKNGKLFLWQVFELPDVRNPIAEFTRNDTARLKYGDFVSGDYMVKLTAFDVSSVNDTLDGCSDFDTVHVTVDPQIELFNYFSPNDDQKNDVWSITMQAVPEYELVIYNRWGEVMYKADQDNDEGVICEENATTGKRACQFWDGTARNGRAAPSGTYFYVFKYRFKGQEELETLNGTITLIRGKND